MCWCALNFDTDHHNKGYALGLQALLDFLTCWLIETVTVNLHTSHCHQLREAEQAIILLPLQHNCLILVKIVQGTLSLPLSSRTALHPIHVLFFLVNMASLPTFDVTIVFVRVCWPSAKKLQRQLLKSEAKKCIEGLSLTALCTAYTVTCPMMKNLTHFIAVEPTFSFQGLPSFFMPLLWSLFSLPLYYANMIS